MFGSRNVDCAVRLPCAYTWFQNLYRVDIVIQQFSNRNDRYFGIRNWPTKLYLKGVAITVGFHFLIPTHDLLLLYEQSRYNNVYTISQ